MSRVLSESSDQKKNLAICNRSEASVNRAQIASWLYTTTGALCCGNTETHSDGPCTEFRQARMTENDTAETIWFRV